MVREPGSGEGLFAYTRHRRAGVVGQAIDVGFLLAHTSLNISCINYCGRTDTPRTWRNLPNELRVLGRESHK